MFSLCGLSFCNTLASKLPGLLFRHLYLIRQGCSPRNPHSSSFSLDETWAIVILVRFRFNYVGLYIVMITKTIKTVSKVSEWVSHSSTQKPKALSNDDGYDTSETTLNLRVQRRPFGGALHLPALLYDWLIKFPTSYVIGQNPLAQCFCVSQSFQKTFKEYFWRNLVHSTFTWNNFGNLTLNTQTLQAKQILWFLKRFTNRTWIHRVNSRLKCECCFW